MLLISFRDMQIQDSLALTLRGNIDHGPRPYHARPNLAIDGGGGTVGHLVRVPIPPTSLGQT